MTNYLRCKVCGFIIKEAKLGEVCPACGAKAQVFEPLKDNVSEKRRKLLELHIHPIMTHFSNGFSAFLVLLIFFTMIIPSVYRQEIFGTIIILSLALPLAVILTFLTGLFDGKTRFKNVKKPHLQKKIIIGSVFIGVSVFLAIYVLIYRVSPENLVYILIISSICLLCGALLGKIGGTLLCAKLPG